MDLDRYRLTSSDQVPPAKPKRAPRHKAGERFLKGPIPMAWIGAAARLPGKALHVGVAIWHIAGLTGQAVVRMERSALESLGIGREAWLRGLERLEGAGLIDVERKPGRRTIVTIRGSTNGESEI